MPHASLKLIPGVNQNMTPALNQTGISTSNLIRFIPDGQNGALPQKLGGWTAYYSQPMAAIVRALWAWEDTNANKYLAVGTENVGYTGQATLQALPVGGSIKNITPQSTAAPTIPVAVIPAGTPSYYTITDIATTGITKYDAVYIVTQISVGGTVLFGMYATDQDNGGSNTTYDVQATDILGTPITASYAEFTGSITGTALTVSSVATGSIRIGQTLTGTGITAGTKVVSGSGASWVVSVSSPSTGTISIKSNAAVTAQFSATLNVSSVTVRLPNHGYSVGSTFPVLIPTAVGGATFSGQYIVQTVPDADTFTIIAPITPTSRDRRRNLPP
jgi:hypothetical protein